MSVSNFPIPANSAHPAEPVGPQWAKLEELKSEYPSIVVKEMVDGGATYGADTTNKIRRFKLNYEGLSYANFAILSAHRTEALDTFLDYSFRHYRTSPPMDELITGAHYESFTFDHTKTWIYSCEIVIIKRPA